MVRIDKEDYEKNVKHNLENSDQYEELAQDTTDDIKQKVEQQVNTMNVLGEMKDTTKEYIVGGEVHPGVYYENPKTHKMNENADLSERFPARGINSIKNTPTERLGDYGDFIVNPGMKSLPTYLRDTKHTLQLIEEKNEEGIPKTAKFLTADIEAMYPNMLMNLCETGISEYLDGRFPKDGNPSTDNVIKYLNICQQNNIFEFMGKLYRQCH